MKNKKILGALLIISIMVVGLGIYGWKTYKSTEIVQEMIMNLCAFSPEKITRMEIYNQELTTLKKNNNKWENEEYREVNYNQELIQGLVKQVSNLSTTQVVKHVQDLGAYGITDASMRLTIYNDLNEAQSFIIGKQLFEHNVTYVYSVEQEILGVVPDTQLATIKLSSGQLIDTTIDFTSLQTMTQFEVQSVDKVLMQLTKEGEVWAVTNPYQKSYVANMETFEAYQLMIQEITKNKFVGIETEKYGLSKPELTLIIDEKPFLTIGSVIDGKRYFTVGEMPYIYQVENSKVKPLLAIDPYKWISQTIYTPAENLQSIEIHYLNDKKSITLPFDEVLLQALYDLSLNAPIANAQIEQSNPREAEVTIRYHYADGTTKTIEYIPYDPSFYLLREDGIVEFSVEKKSVINAITPLLKAEEAVAVVAEDVIAGEDKIDETLQLIEE